MKKYGKLAALAAALILVIGLAAAAYNKLKAEAELPSLTEENAEEDPGAERQDAIDVTFYDSEGKAVKLSDFYGKTGGDEFLGYLVRLL